MLNRLTFASSLSHLRRVSTPLEKSGKQAKPRQLHNTHWGYICPAETPEGQAVGLVKNLALMCEVSTSAPAQPVMDCLDYCGLEHFTEISAADLADKRVTKVFVDGNWVGITREPLHLTDKLIQGRRREEINHSVSVVRDIKNSELRVATDAGRCLRPLFVVERDEITGMQGLSLKGADLVDLQRRDTTFSNLLLDGRWSSSTRRRKRRFSSPCRPRTASTAA